MFSNNDNSLASLVVALGQVLVLAGMAWPIALGGFDSDAFRYVFASGAVLTLVGRLFMPAYKGDNMRLKRLIRLQTWSAIFYCVAAFFLFYDTTNLRDWIAFTLAGAAVQIVSSVMIGVTQRRKRN